MGPPGAISTATTLLADMAPVTASCPCVSLLILVQPAGVGGGAASGELVHCCLRKSWESAYQICSPLASRRSVTPTVFHGNLPIMLAVVDPTQSESPSPSASGQGSAPG